MSKKQPIKAPNHTVEKVLNKLFCCEENIPRHAPKVLILYGSLRKPSYSFYLAKEAAKLLVHFGADVKMFDPKDLPVANIGQTNNPDESQLPESVKELRTLVHWSEAMVWISPEIHGNMSAVLKNQIDWLPLSIQSIRPTQGKILSVMQVAGGSQSFNVVNNLRVLGRWMRMVVIPNQASVPKAFEHFDAEGNMKDSPNRDRVVDCMEELFKFTLLLRGNMKYLVQRYSEDVYDEDDLKKVKDIKAF